MIWLVTYRNPSGSVWGVVGSTVGTRGGRREASEKAAVLLLVREDHHSDLDSSSGVERNIWFGIQFRDGINKNKYSLFTNRRTEAQRISMTCPRLPSDSMGLGPAPRIPRQKPPLHPESPS